MKNKILVFSATYNERENIRELLHVIDQIDFKLDILIIDDVITAGTAIREAQDIINANDANTKGVIVALDRQEKGKGELSAIQEVEQIFGIRVLSIINLSHIIDYLKASKNEDVVSRIESYRSQYGII